MKLREAGGDTGLRELLRKEGRRWREKRGQGGGEGERGEKVKQWLKRERVRERG